MGKIRIWKKYYKAIFKKINARSWKKYNERNLRYMCQFYEMIIKTKWNTVCSKLSWSHYREVLSLKNLDEIKEFNSKAIIQFNKTKCFLFLIRIS